MTHQLTNTSSKSCRSHSTPRTPTTNRSIKDQRRKSVAHVGVLKSNSTLKVHDSSVDLSRRRYSSIKLESTPKFSGSPSSRSRSLKSPSQLHRQSADASDVHNAGGTTARSFSYSLSVPGDENDFHRLRNFSITSKGIINRGDSFRRKSSSASRPSSPKAPPILEGQTSPNTGLSSNEHIAGSDIVSQPEADVAGASAAVPVASCSTESTAPKYNVCVMGSSGVGKSSLRLQFMTSEYICESESFRDENNKNVTIVLDGDEVELELSEYTGFDEKTLMDALLPDAFLIVYSVTNRRSYLHAKKILSQVEPLSTSRAIILVGNKTDLVRLRTVSTVEGRSLAKEWGVKFIETSVAINHQVDELLVGIVTQIRLRAKMNEKNKKRDHAKGFSDIPATRRKNKATGIIIRLWRKTCMTNKSCDNLHSV